MKKTTKKAISAAGMISGAAALVFIILSIAADSTSGWSLPLGSLFVAIGVVCSMIVMRS
ncbi:MAG: hypothetical protein J6F31_02495 [Oscillospiraceae bacterium]|nr:hypothetical protein [Oscillospiraceae bacterium]